MPPFAGAAGKVNSGSDLDAQSPTAGLSLMRPCQCRTGSARTGPHSGACWATLASESVMKHGLVPTLSSSLPLTMKPEFPSPSRSPGKATLSQRRRPR